jgi:hypothetical protein
MIPKECERRYLYLLGILPIWIILWEVSNEYKKNISRFFCLFLLYAVSPSYAQNDSTRRPGLLKEYDQQNVDPLSYFQMVLNSANGKQLDRSYYSARCIPIAQLGYVKDRISYIDIRKRWKKDAIFGLKKSSLTYAKTIIETCKKDKDNDVRSWADEIKE